MSVYNQSYYCDNWINNGEMMKALLKTFAMTVALLAFGIPAHAAELPQIHGFAEAAFGMRFNREPETKHSRYNLLEQRLQLKTYYAIPDDLIPAEYRASLRLKGDFTVDEYFGAKTAFDLREAFLAFSPLEQLDLKLGRQVLTWGTGDYLFINDVFPKDYVSFFIGRDDEYLKKPSDALRLSLYPQAVHVDFVVIPFFEPNTLAEGDRVSFFDSFQQGISGRNSDRDLLEPARQADNFEYAGRLYRTFGQSEAALYWFRGFDHSPRSYKNEAARQLYYQRQDVYGGSLRAPALGGIASAEAGYLYSPEDSDGSNRLIENSMLKAMAGYEKDLGNDLKIGLQYYYEQKLDYDSYRAALLSTDYFWDQRRHVVTQRLTKLFKSQTVMVSIFSFYSPSDADGYLRPSVSYDVNDQWKLTLGANLPWGEDAMTEFGQMTKNKNLYARMRYSF
jgi:hypothetical protein